MFLMCARFFSAAVSFEGFSKKAHHEQLSFRFYATKLYTVHYCMRTVCSVRAILLFLNRMNTVCSARAILLFLNCVNTVCALVRYYCMRTV